MRGLLAGMALTLLLAAPAWPGPGDTATSKLPPPPPDSGKCRVDPARRAACHVAWNDCVGTAQPAGVDCRDRWNDCCKDRRIEQGSPTPPPS